MKGTVVGQGICTEDEARMIAKKFYENYSQNQSMNDESLRKLLFDANRAND